MQAEIASKVTDALQATLTPAEATHAAKRPTDNLAAYDLYLRASQLRQFQEPNERAIGMLQKAVELDSAFSDAMADLATRLLVRTLYWNHGLTEDAIEWAQKAVAADPNSSKLTTRSHLPMLFWAGYPALVKLCAEPWK